MYRYSSCYTSIVLLILNHHSTLIISTRCSASPSCPAGASSSDTRSQVDWIAHIYIYIYIYIERERENMYIYIYIYVYTYIYIYVYMYVYIYIYIYIYMYVPLASSRLTQIQSSRCGRRCRTRCGRRCRTRGTVDAELDTRSLCLFY